MGTFPGRGTNGPDDPAFAHRMEASMNCAFIGFGAAAYGICLGLRQAGLHKAYFYKHRDTPPFTGQLAARVAATGAEYVPDYARLAEASPIVFSVVVGSAALEAAELAAPHLTRDHLFVDMNTASPAVKAKAAAMVEATGAGYVDAAIMGPVEALGHTVPVMACGSGATAFAKLFAPLGMRIAVLDGPAGRAAAVKLLRSVFQKGMMCLFIEMLLAARVYGVEETVVASVAETFDGVGLETMAGRMVPKAVSSAARMRAEMCEVRESLRGMGLPSFMSAASAECFAWCEGMDLANLPYADIDQAMNGIQGALRNAVGQVPL